MMHKISLYSHKLFLILFIVNSIIQYYAASEADLIHTEFKNSATSNPISQPSDTDIHQENNVGNEPNESYRANDQEESLSKVNQINQETSNIEETTEETNESTDSQQSDDPNEISMKEPFPEQNKKESPVKTQTNTNTNQNSADDLTNEGTLESDKEEENNAQSKSKQEINQNSDQIIQETPQTTATDLHSDSDLYTNTNSDAATEIPTDTNTRQDTDDKNNVATNSPNIMNKATDITNTHPTKNDLSNIHSSDEQKQQQSLLSQESNMANTNNDINNRLDANAHENIVTDTYKDITEDNDATTTTSPVTNIIDSSNIPTQQDKQDEQKNQQQQQQLQQQQQQKQQQQHENKQQSQQPTSAQETPGPTTNTDTNTNKNINNKHSDKIQDLDDLKSYEETTTTITTKTKTTTTTKKKEVGNKYTKNKSYDSSRAEHFGYNGPNGDILEVKNDKNGFEQHFADDFNNGCTRKHLDIMAEQCTPLAHKLIDVVHFMRYGPRINNCVRAKYACFNHQFWHDLANCSCNICNHKFWYWNQELHNQFGMYWDDHYCSYSHSNLVNISNNDINDNTVSIEKEYNYPYYDMKELSFCEFLSHQQNPLYKSQEPIECIQDINLRNKYINKIKNNKNIRNTVHTNKAKQYAKKHANKNNYHDYFQKMLNKLLSHDTQSIHSKIEIDIIKFEAGTINDIHDTIENNNDNNVSDQNDQKQQKNNKFKGSEVIKPKRQENRRQQQRQQNEDDVRDSSSQLPQSKTSQAVYIIGTAFLGLTLMFSCYLLVGR